MYKSVFRKINIQKIRFISSKLQFLAWQRSYLSCSYSKFKYDEISVDDLVKFNQGRPTTATELCLSFVQLWAHIPMAVINRSVNSMYMICVAVLIQCTWYVLLYSTPIEDIHYTDFHSSHLQNMWCIVYKGILLEITFQYLLLILLYFKIKPFHTLIYAKFLCDSVYNKRKVLMDLTSALQKTCIFGCF